MFLNNSYYKGILTEYIAIIYLFFHGYTILKRRYKTKFGEVDIIASKNKAIIGVKDINFAESIQKKYNGGDVIG